MTIVTNPQALLAEQAAEVVGKLSAAQLKTIKRGYLRSGRGMWPLCSALRDKGLLKPGPPMLEDFGIWTPLGLATRAILIERQGK